MVSLPLKTEMRKILDVNWRYIHRMNSVGIPYRRYALSLEEGEAKKIEAESVTVSMIRHILKETYHNQRIQFQFE